MRAAVFRAPGSIVVQDVATLTPAAGRHASRLPTAECAGATCIASWVTCHSSRLRRVTRSAVLSTCGAGRRWGVAGDRVCVEPIVPCGSCWYCNTGHHQLCTDACLLAAEVAGGFAEYVCVPPRCCPAYRL
jgi:hypothetical protein